MGLNPEQQAQAEQLRARAGRLRERRERPSTTATSSEAAAASEPPAESRAPACPRCSIAPARRLEVLGRTVVLMCAACAAAESDETAAEAARAGAERRERVRVARAADMRPVLARAGVNVIRWVERTPARFDTFDPKPDAVARDACREYAKAFIRGERTNLYLTSARDGEAIAPGCGKTHLAVAIVEAILRHAGELEPGRDVRFVYSVDLFDALRATFDTPAEGLHRTRRRLFVDPELLVIDDLGVNRFSDWEIEQLAAVFTGREGKATVTTSNYTPGQLLDLGPTDMARIVSRVSEARLVCLEGPDRRPRPA